MMRTGTDDMRMRGRTGDTGASAAPEQWVVRRECRMGAARTGRAGGSQCSVCLQASRVQGATEMQLEAVMG